MSSLGLSLEADINYHPGVLQTEQGTDLCVIPQKTLWWKIRLQVLIRVNHGVFHEESVNFHWQPVLIPNPSIFSQMSGLASRFLKDLRHKRSLADHIRKLE